MSNDTRIRVASRNGQSEMQYLAPKLNSVCLRDLYNASLQMEGDRRNHDTKNLHTTLRSLCTKSVGIKYPTRSIKSMDDCDYMTNRDGKTFNILIQINEADASGCLSHYFVPSSPYRIHCADVCG